MNKSEYNRYMHRALLNREVRLYRSYVPSYLRWLGIYKKIEVMIFTVRKDNNEEESECFQSTT